MTDLAKCEFEALRATIRTRGMARPIAFLAGLSVWAAILAATLAWIANPIAAVIPLLILVGVFEVVRSLHTGVERIGRYVQVFFEETNDQSAVVVPPAWERTAMAFGPTLPGAAGHPLFLPIFLLATVVNLTAVMLPGPLLVEVGTLLVPHAAFLIWMLYCDRAMRRQRSAELARFREMRKGTRSDSQSDSLRS